MTTAVRQALEAARARRGAALAGLVIFCVFAVLLGLGRGAFAVPAAEVGQILATHLLGSDSTASAAADAVVWQLRLPRTLLGLAVGASLATAGALFQGLFRNPLADPGLLGITLGAAAAVALAVLGAGSALTWLGLSAEALSAWRPYLVPMAAFTGSLLTLLLVVGLAGGPSALDVSTLLLAGIAVNAIAGAVTGFAIFLADDAQLRDLTFWTLGGLGGASWTVVLTTVPPLLLALAITPTLAARLDCLLLGEEAAAHLGVPVAATKRWVVGIGALLVGVSVSAAGAIGFVGLVVPHLIRLALGPGHRLLLPASALLGAGGLVLADVLARTLFAPAEVPIGVLTTLLGGPFFLALIVARRRAAWA